MAALRALLVLAWAGTTMALLFLLQLPVMLATGSGDFSLWLARHVWAPACLRAAGVRLEGRPAALPPGPVIVASNHESLLDVLALVRLIPRNLRFVTKRELFRLPVFGWYLRLARFIEVDRTDRDQAVAALRAAAERVRAGLTVVVFPEGTRSRDGLVLPFKKGPFAMALEAGVPVVPAAVVGAHAVQPKGTVELRPGPIRVAFGAPLDPARFPDRISLLAATRRAVIALHRSLGGKGGDESAAVADGSEGEGARF